MKFVVLYFSGNSLVIERFTGVVTSDNYIEFDDKICGWYGISYSTLGTMTENMVFCLDNVEAIRDAKLLLLDNIEYQISEAKQELEYLNDLKGELSDVI